MMKKYVLLILAALLLICTMYSTINVRAVQAAGVGKQPTPHVSTAKLANSHAAFVTGDPYTTGCAQNVSPANSGTLEINGTTVAWIYNYYSTSCNANWVYMVYNTSVIYYTFIDIHKQGLTLPANPSSNHQCYLTDCSSWYNGRISPTWTNMVDGTPKNCILADIEGKNSTGQFQFASTYNKDGNTDDALCA